MQAHSYCIKIKNLEEGWGKKRWLAGKTINFEEG